MHNYPENKSKQVLQSNPPASPIISVIISLQFIQRLALMIVLDLLILQPFRPASLTEKYLTCFLASGRYIRKAF